MNQNKNFAAQLMASVGSFVALPLLFHWFYVAIQNFAGADFMLIGFAVMFVLAVAIIAMETVAMAMAKKGKEMGKVYNIITMVLNALFAVLAIAVLVYVIAGTRSFDFYDFLELCGYFMAAVFAGAANGTAFGFKLFNMLKK